MEKCIKFFMIKILFKKMTLKIHKMIDTIQKDKRRNISYLGLDIYHDSYPLFPSLFFFYRKNVIFPLFNTYYLKKIIIYRYYVWDYCFNFKG